MRKLHDHFINHLRSYRTFNFLFFTFFLLITSITIHIFSSTSHAEDLLEQAFKPAMTNETIINLGAGKNAVGNEILREGVGVSVSLGEGCMVNGDLVSKNNVDIQMNSMNYANGDDHAFCEQVLGGTWDATVVSTTKEAPLIVRIAKFLLRITMVLSVTMVIYNGVMWIIESAKGAEVKDAKKNITLIVTGIIIALMSLGIINLISSITISSLGTTPTGISQSCVIDGNVYAGENLKEYVCEHAFAGKRYADRIGDRCRVDYYKDNPQGDFDNPGAHRAPITNGEMTSKCIELGGQYTP